MTALYWLYGVSFVVALAASCVYLRKYREDLVQQDVIETACVVLMPVLNTILAFCAVCIWARRLAF